MVLKYQINKNNDKIHKCYYVKQKCPDCLRAVYEQLKVCKSALADVLAGAGGVVSAGR